ncbi:MAG: hypothetical protein ISS31_08275 [Kiritimatiellae bacterium]|nr:hypothetical protein [Kiritimatiellia bacterium]
MTISNVHFRLWLSCMILSVSVSSALGSAKMLSSQSDTKDSTPARAVGSSSEATAFWGLAGVLGGMREAKAASVDVGRSVALSYAGKSGNFYKAAFLLSEKRRGDVIGALASSGNAKETALAGAALAIGATGDHLLDERATARIVAGHSGSPAKGKKGKGRKGKGKPSVLGSEAKTALPTLLASKDPQTVYFAIQAAAYSRDRSLSEAVSAVALQDGKIAGAKLYYRTMIGEKPTKEEIIAAVNAAGKRTTSSRGNVPLLGFDVDLPGLCFVCKAIGEVGGEMAVPILNKAYTMGDSRVQIDAVRAMAKLGSEAFLPTLNKAVIEAPWYVLVDVCRATGAIPSEKMVPALIKRLTAEKGRVRLDLTHALSAIAGSQVATDAKGWTAWWTKERGSFTVDPAATKEFLSQKRPQDMDIMGLGYFYGLSIYSDHFAYVVDSSLSMKGDRIASLKENLTGSIEALNPIANYSVVDFGGDIEVMSPPELTTSHSKGKKRVYEMDMSLATRSFCAIRQAMVLPELDTLYFLSDGAPAMDSMKKWDGIIRGAVVMARYYPVAMFCIDFDPSAGNQASMMRLAADNHGLHESVAVGPASEDFDVGGAAKKKRKKK